MYSGMGGRGAPNYVLHLSADNFNMIDKDEAPYHPNLRTGFDDTVVP